MAYHCEKYNIEAILLTLTEQQTGDITTDGVDITRYSEGVSFGFMFLATNNDELTITIDESEDNTTWSEVPEERLLTPVYPIVHDDTDQQGETLLQVGVLSDLQYLRANITIVNQGNGYSSYIFLVGKLKQKPDVPPSSF